MSDTVDHAEVITRQLADAAVARSQAVLAMPGASECDDCGDDIPPARRAAMPSAKRCARCQGRFEKVCRA